MAPKRRKYPKKTKRRRKKTTRKQRRRRRTIRRTNFWSFRKKKWVTKYDEEPPLTNKSPPTVLYDLIPQILPFLEPKRDASFQIVKQGLIKHDEIMKFMKFMSFQTDFFQNATFGKHLKRKRTSSSTSAQRGPLEKLQFIQSYNLRPEQRSFSDCKNQECSICLKPMLSKKPVKTECDHVFHLDCINSWKKINNSCPLCKKKPLVLLPNSIENALVVTIQFTLKEKDFVRVGNAMKEKMVEKKDRVTLKNPLIQFDFSHERLIRKNRIMISGGNQRMTFDFHDFSNDDYFFNYIDDGDDDYKDYGMDTDNNDQRPFSKSFNLKISLKRIGKTPPIIPQRISQGGQFLFSEFMNTPLTANKKMYAAYKRAKSKRKSRRRTKRRRQKK